MLQVILAYVQYWNLCYFFVCTYIYTHCFFVFIFHASEIEREENAFCKLATFWPCAHYFSWTWMVSHRWAHTIFHIRFWVLWLGTLPGLWTWWLVCLGGANASDGQNAEPRCPWSITELLQLHTYYSNQECSNELSVPFACPILKTIWDFQSGRGETHSLILHMNHFMLWLHSICIHMIHAVHISGIACQRIKFDVLEAARCICQNSGSSTEVFHKIVHCMRVKLLHECLKLKISLWEGLEGQDVL